ncbi:hypothetical protein ILYODFUR_026027 [Ilyodon furcidens]|uniref:Uncharacterized protein n=1 Tax=Ilyodon furcidens TaxID=33524 RepID=A0ABV0TF20_9TELE
MAADMKRKHTTKQKGHRDPVPMSSGIRAGGEVHPGQVTDHRRTTQRHTGPATMHAYSVIPKGNLETSQPNSHGFGLWEEAGVPGENPSTHRKIMQTLCRKTPG